MSQTTLPTRHFYSLLNGFLSRRQEDVPVDWTAGVVFYWETAQAYRHVALGNDISVGLGLNGELSQRLRVKGSTVAREQVVELTLIFNEELDLWTLLEVSLLDRTGNWVAYQVA
jgi:hypothetical protein